MIKISYPVIMRLLEVVYLTFATLENATTTGAASRAIRVKNCIATICFSKCNV